MIEMYIFSNTQKQYDITVQHIFTVHIIVCVAEQLSVVSSSKRKPKVVIFSVLLGVIILLFHSYFVPAVVKR